MVSSMTRGQAWPGHDVVVHQQHDLRAALGDAELERPQVATVVAHHGTQHRVVDAELFEKRRRPVHVAIEHHDHFADRRVGPDSLDEALQHVTTISRRHDDGDGRQSDVGRPLGRRHDGVDSSTNLATPSPPPRSSRDGVLARMRRSLQKVQVST